MKSEAAIVETVMAPALAAVRAAYATLRELDDLVARQAVKLEKIQRSEARAREAHGKQRLELGRALVEARKGWPARGPKAKGWGEFLAAEGIDERTALSWMHLAGHVEDFGINDGDAEIPTQREVSAARRSDEQPDLPLGPTNEAESRVEIVSRGTSLDLRLGDYREVLRDIGTVDALITDAPFDERTHASTNTRDDGVDPEGMAPTYPPWTPDDVRSFIDWAAPRTRGWICAITSDELIPAWKAAYRAHDRYAFPPVPCIIEGMSFRRAGDGPSSEAVYLMVSRPSSLSRWGTLPGKYVGPRVEGAKGGRGKPPWLMESIVRDYTRHADLVCDPLAGFGETLFAAKKQGRRAVGAEIDEAARLEALARWCQRSEST